jgi:hypothetical protein
MGAKVPMESADRLYERWGMPSAWGPRLGAGLAEIGEMVKTYPCWTSRLVKLSRSLLASP